MRAGLKGPIVGGALLALLVVTIGAVVIAKESDRRAQVRDAVATVTVYKDPACGCCSKWVEHLRQNGFEVTTVETDNLGQVMARYGITPELAACHTAVVDGYVIEGHVPADLIVKLLKDRPKVAGLAVPGMPMGSPGMEGPTKEPYDVLAFDGEGHTTVYAHR